MRIKHEVKRFFGLSLAIARAEFKLRNEGSYLGILWYLLNPLLSFFILLLIFQGSLGKEIPQYALYLFLGLIMFNLFQDITNEATRVIRNYGGIIKSISFPKSALVGSLLFKKSFAHLFEVLLFGALLYSLNGSVVGLLFYPFVFILIITFTFGASLVMGGLVAYIIDIANVWEFASKLLWLATPLFYGATNEGVFKIINLVNPVYYYLTLGRELVIYQRIPPANIFIGSIGFAVFAVVIGIYVFKKLETKFAERM